MLQWLNLLFFLLPNVISYGPKCFRIKDSRNVGGPLDAGHVLLVVPITTALK